MQEYISVSQHREMVSNYELEKGMILHIDNTRFVVLDDISADGVMYVFGLKQDIHTGAYKHESIELDAESKSQLLGHAKHLEVTVRL